MTDSLILLALAFSVAVSGCISNLESSQNYDTSITENILDIQDIKQTNGEFNQNLYLIDNNSNVPDGLNNQEVIAARQNSFVADLFNQPELFKRHSFFLR